MINGRPLYLTRSKDTCLYWNGTNWGFSRYKRDGDIVDTFYVDSAVDEACPSDIGYNQWTYIRDVNYIQNKYKNLTDAFIKMDSFSFTCKG